MKENTSRDRFTRIVTIPIRALAKARDLYVKSMNGYAERSCYGGASSYADPLPRSFSTSSTRAGDGVGDLKELIRAASSRAYSEKLDLTALDHHLHRKPPRPPSHRRNTKTAGSLLGLQRSASVGMGKIDEDAPCELGDVEFLDTCKKDKKNESPLFVRSSSYAISSMARR